MHSFLAKSYAVDYKRIRVGWPETLQEILVPTEGRVNILLPVLIFVLALNCLRREVV